MKEGDLQSCLDDEVETFISVVSRPGHEGGAHHAMLWLLPLLVLLLLLLQRLLYNCLLRTFHFLFLVTTALCKPCAEL